MLQRLLELDRRAGLLARARRLPFPGGMREVMAPIYVWRWYDLLIDKVWGPNEVNMLRKAELASRLQDIALSEALARVVAGHVHWYESRGADLTDKDALTRRR